MAQIVPKKTYVTTWLALVVLLAATFLVSRCNLRPFNTAIALVIAFTKMALIILFFMHVRYSRRVIWMFVCAGFLWLFIMIELTMSDYLTRGFSWSQ
jgi:cytochrome c oxidase subunit 4